MNSTIHFLSIGNLITFLKLLSFHMAVCCSLQKRKLKLTEVKFLPKDT